MNPPLTTDQSEMIWILKLKSIQKKKKKFIINSVILFQVNSWLTWLEEAESEEEEEEDEDD